MSHLRLCLQREGSGMNAGPNVPTTAPRVTREHNVKRKHSRICDCLGIVNYSYSHLLEHLLAYLL